MINKLIENMVFELQEELIVSLKELINIYSVEGEKEENAPFGKGPKEALDYVLNLSEKLGFKTKNIDNMVGYAQYGEDNEKGYIGIFAHVDVVSIGKGWTKDPLKASVENNRIYGRGALDSKSPTLSNLYAIYALKKLGIKPVIPIRIVFGTNEESGFKCVKHYLTKEKAPIFGWTPDCKWPVVYGERGRVRFRISSKQSNLSVLYKFITEYILSSTNDGKKLGICYRDEDFGTLVTRGYEIKEENNMSHFDFSVSHPANCTMESLKKDIEKILPGELELSVLGYFDTVLYDKNSIYVQTLQKVYNEVTKLDATPVTTTGGTYAKIVPNIIAYGPSFPGQKDIAHLPDEWMDLDDIRVNTNIYAKALYELNELFKKEKN